MPENLGLVSIIIHKNVHPGGRFPFSVRLWDQAQNAHYVHAAFSPSTYQTRWKPLLENRLGRHDEHIAPLQSRDFERLSRRLRRRSVRTEEQFFEEHPWYNDQRDQSLRVTYWIEPPQPRAFSA